MKSGCFLVASLGFSICSSISSANSDFSCRSFPPTFPTLVSFISFSSLIAVARTSKTLLSNSGKSGHPCLIPDIRGNAFRLSPLSITLAVGLSYMAFFMLRHVPCTLTFWRFYLKCWIFAKAFSASLEMIIWFLFSLLLWCILLINFQILKNLCIPGINPTWSCCIILLMCCWVQIASILMIFASVFVHSDVGL